MQKKSIEELSIGDFYEKKFVISEEMGMEFAKISQDFNPIHLDIEVATKSRFGKKIVHGMLIGSYFSGIIGNQFPGAGSVYMSQEISFRHPIYYETEILIRVEIIDIVLDKKYVALRTSCFNMQREILVDGKAKILFE